MPSDVQKKVVDDIAEVGWHVLKILPEADQPGWAYTIGLTESYGHPEMCVFGLGGEAAHLLLNQLGEEVAEGARFGPGVPDPDLLVDLDCHFRPVLSRWYEPFLGTAVRYYGDREFQAVQLFWPDRENRSPWHEEFDDRLADRQPLLYLESPEEGRIAHWLESLE